VQVTGIAAGTHCQLAVTGPRGQQVVAGGWIITTGGPAAWYPASVPFRASSVRGFTVTAGGTTLVTVPARTGRSPAQSGPPRPGMIRLPGDGSSGGLAWHD
jgi:hypothetical protein